MSGDHAANFHLLKESYKKSNTKEGSLFDSQLLFFHVSPNIGYLEVVDLDNTKLISKKMMMMDKGNMILSITYYLVGVAQSVISASFSNAWMMMIIINNTMSPHIHMFPVYTRESSVRFHYFMKP